MIPIIMYEQSVDAQMAADIVVAMLRDSSINFIEAEERLFETEMDSSLRTGVELIVQGCKNIIKGGAHWA
jgi:hypothetical protein